MADLAEISALAARLGMDSAAEDFDVDLSTDDMIP